MPGQSSSCTFALSAGDSDHLFAVSAQKQLGLRSDPLQYSDRFIGKDNPRRFNDDIICRQSILIAIPEYTVDTFREFLLPDVCDRQFCSGNQLLQHVERCLSFPAIPQNQDIFSLHRLHNMIQWQQILCNFRFYRLIFICFQHEKSLANRSLSAFVSLRILSAKAGGSRFCC